MQGALHYPTPAAPPAPERPSRTTIIVRAKRPAADPLDQAQQALLEAYALLDVVAAALRAARAQQGVLSGQA